MECYLFFWNRHVKTLFSQRSIFIGQRWLQNSAPGESQSREQCTNWFLLNIVTLRQIYIPSRFSQVYVYRKIVYRYKYVRRPAFSIFFCSKSACAYYQKNNDQATIDRKFEKPRPCRGVRICALENAVADRCYRVFPPRRSRLLVIGRFAGRRWYYYTRVEKLYYINFPIDTICSSAPDFPQFSAKTPPTKRRVRYCCTTS